MKPIILVLENPGYDLHQFILSAQEQFPQYSFLKTIEANESKFVEGLVHVKKALRAEYLSKFPNLKFIGTAFTGYDSVENEYCIKKGISVYNVPEYSTNSVAELTIGMTISLLREIPRGGDVLQQGEWHMTPGRELFGKTIAIIGTGAIGCRVAEIFHAFGCKIHGWSRTEREAFHQSGGVYFPSIAAAVKKANIVSIHIPSTEETKGIFGQKEIEAMRSDAYLINTARGPVVAEDALLEALNKNSIAGAALDVFDNEPLQKEHPFRTMTNVIATPHIAFKTEEALKRKSEITIQNIGRFISGDPLNRVL